jgi:hypothetical protein
MGIKRIRCNLTSRNLNTLPSAPLISFKSPCVTEELMYKISIEVNNLSSLSGTEAESLWPQIRVFYFILGLEMGAES